jgi:hypothetical protein
MKGYEPEKISSFSISKDLINDLSLDIDGEKSYANDKGVVIPPNAKRIEIDESVVYIWSKVYDR